MLIENKSLSLSVILLAMYAFTLINLSYQEGLTLYSKLVGLGIVALFAIRFVRGHTSRAIPLEFGIWLMWFFWALITSIYAINIDLAFAKIFSLIQLFILSVAIYSTIVSLRTSMLFWAAFVAVTLIACFVTLANPDKFISWDGRISGPLGNANLFGVTLVSSLAVSLAYAATAKSWMVRIACFAVSIFLFFMVAETGSRKGMVGSILILLTVSAVVLNHLRKKSATKLLLAFVAGLIMITSSIAYLASSQHIQRFEKAAAAVAAGDLSQADGSIQHRAQFAEIAISRAVQHPILGIGLDNFREIDLGFFRSPATYSHSNYLEIMVSTGIPGLILYCLIYAALISKLYTLWLAQLPQRALAPFAICLSIVPMIAFFDFAMVSYYEKVSWLLLSAVIAQIEILKRRYIAPPRS